MLGKPGKADNHALNPARGQGQHALELRLLYLAYGRQLLNLSMTAVTALIVTACCWTLFPPRLLLLWCAILLASVLHCYVLQAAFHRARPSQIGHWQRHFILQTTIAGFCWALAPLLLMPYAHGVELAMFVGLLLSVCGVAMTSLSEQETGMRCFLAAALLPLALQCALGSDQIQQLVALVLVGGMLCLFAVGYNANQTTRALIASQFQMRAILDTAQDAIIGIDGQVKIHDWNVRAQTLFGWDSAEVLGQTLFVTILPQQAGQQVRAGLDEFLSGRSQGIVNARLELHVQERIGREFAAEFTLTAQATAQDWHFTAFIADISARKENERMKNDFISTVSHELRTPLTSIRGALALLEGGVMGDMPVKAQNLLQVANKNSQRLITLVNDILDMEKLMSGKMTLHSDQLDLAAFLLQAIEAHAGYAASFKVRYVLAGWPDTSGACKVMADADRLMQVLANLLSNAAKFSRAGGEVVVRILPQPGNPAATPSALKPYWRVEVQDFGEGIPAEFQGRIFEQF
ncbi:MAG: hypothetical protein RL748_3036, partial [Pseudomonadota bacterium]